MNYKDRANHCQSILGKRLLQLMEDKKTNLALSADVTQAEILLQLAESHGPDICMLKTHIDIIDNFNEVLIKKLQLLAKKYDFLIFEDRKFADIGNTVKHQYANGIYRIVEWAEVINAHPLPGPSIIQGLSEAANGKKRGLILIAEMSSKGHLMDANYIQATLKMAEQFPDFVMGFITQHALTSHPRWINFTPGIHMSETGDMLGQQYISPEKAILTQRTDVIIVGRGIIQARDPIAAAKKFREAGWQAYQQRCKE
jgi:uridine monophosphate synthetase